ncbi:MAG: hypothetical protein U0793_10685 [Gemmataceae bacterium]
MAEDQLGQRKDTARTPWTKIFSTFKVALDIKKLLLAAAGIVVMAFGWYVLSWIFFSLGGTTPPQWKDYEPQKGADAKAKEEGWQAFKSARVRWNLRYQLAGPADNHRVDALDFLLDSSLEEFEAYEYIRSHMSFDSAPVSIKSEGGVAFLVIDSSKFAIGPLKAEDKLDTLTGRPYLVRDLRVVDEKLQTISVGGAVLKLEKADAVPQFVALLADAKTLAQIEAEIGSKTPETQKVWRRALDVYLKTSEAGKLAYKPHGRLRVLPWFENRGPNPYLLVTGSLKHPEAEAKRGALVGWLVSDQAPVLLEPLYKFLSPVAYLFAPNAGFWNRLYLFLIIVWTIFTWSFFGAAICRMAAVQLARNEKVGLREALAFARQRCRSYFFAPILPLLFIGLLTFFLIIFGILIGHTYFFGDIFLVPLFWPLVIVFGLIMAVVVVGLVGYPLMNPTISTEGTDSFDALSRSYSYVYQAPWQYIWYSFLAILYGAVLVFFVGFMGSLMVYLGKWGLAQAPWLASSDPARDREPQYLFVWSPTSFGWRNLLIGDSPHAVATEAVSPGGVPFVEYKMSDDYMKNMSIPNYIGAFFVSIWVYLFFLLILGFGYSYFWTASSLIYLLMRRHVDDTDLDEVYLEEEEGPEAFTQDMTTPAPTPPAPAPATTGLTMVDAPTLRADTGVPPPSTPAATVSPLAPPPTSSAKVTQLAPPPGESPNPDGHSEGPPPETPPPAAP